MPAKWNESGIEKKTSGGGSLGEEDGLGPHLSRVKPASTENQFHFTGWVTSSGRVLGLSQTRVYSPD